MQAAATLRARALSASRRERRRLHERSSSSVRPHAAPQSPPPTFRGARPVPTLVKALHAHDSGRSHSHNATSSWFLSVAAVAATAAAVATSNKAALAEPPTGTPLPSPPSPRGGKALRKRKTSTGNERFVISSAAVRGDRATMEDTSFVSGCKRFAAVFDGHGGAAVSEHLRQHYYALLAPTIAKLDEESAARHAEALATSAAAAPRSAGSDAPPPVVVTSAARRQEILALLKTSLEKLDAEVARKNEWRLQGSTATGVLLLDDVIYTVNVGDCRAVMCRSGDALDLTRDHKPNDPSEQSRVESLGGSVQWHGYVDAQGEPIEPYGAYRINGNLAVARAIGDRDLRPFVTGEPEVKAFKRDEQRDEFIVIASDGLWDVFTSDEVVTFVQDVMSGEVGGRESWRSGGHSDTRVPIFEWSHQYSSDRGMIKAARKRRKQQIANYLVQEALYRGTSDNVSVIVVWLRADGVSFITESAPLLAHHSSHDLNDEDDEDDVFAPRTMYRDTHHTFASGPGDSVFASEAFAESSSFFSAPGKVPVFVLESTPSKSLLQKGKSPLSPSSYAETIDVPVAPRDAFFQSNPRIPSSHSPAKIMAALQAALRTLDCDVEVIRQWTLRVSLLCVAELLTFSIDLSRVADAPGSYVVDFSRRAGCETKFLELAEHIRFLCSDVDSEALPFFGDVLDPWVDAKQEISGRRFAISEALALSHLQLLNADGEHSETLYHAAKFLKDSSRHRGNRKLLLAADRKLLLKSLKWMLSSGADELTRFGVFILAQYAKDEAESRDDCAAPFFASAYEKSSFALLLDEAESLLSGAPCARFMAPLVELAQQSWLFC
ncbi:hypothetical protein PybrP1_012480 [[Pythium] brassicae (nom. inval.)]|nr:hypothetical protein PybrP1_012480 [[Pythium] brassicae (nom. inval.)]